MGAIRDFIAAAMADGSLTDAQRRRLIRRIRAQQIRNALPAMPFTFTPGQFSITVESASFDAANDALTVVLSASRAGVPIPLDNPFVYINPPTHVPDPNGDYIRTDPKSGLVATFSEAPLLAFRAMVLESVRLQAR